MGFAPSARAGYTVVGDAMEAATRSAPGTAKSSPAHRLPPGPPLPTAVQTAIWSRAARRMQFACRRRYGDTFTIRIAHEGVWVMVSDP